MRTILSIPRASRGGPSLDSNHVELVVKGIRIPLLFTRQPIKPSGGFSLEPPSLSALGRKLVLLGDTCRLRSPWSGGQCHEYFDP